MPSERHNELAVAGLRWLQNKVTGRGLRGGFEVPIAEGYVADAVALCALQHRFALRYVGEEHFERVTAYEVLVPEVACVFEAKATRSDFLSTFGGGNRHTNRATAIGNLHWIVCGRGVAKAEDAPEFWGLLEFRGRGLNELRKPIYVGCSEAARSEIAYQILWYAKNNHKRFAATVYDELRH